MQFGVGDIIGAASLLVAAVGLYLAWRQTQLTIRQMTAAGQTIPTRPWWFSWHIGTLILLVILAWIPRFTGPSQSEPQVAKAPTAKLVRWGPSTDHENMVFVSIDASGLRQFTHTHKLILVVFHNSTQIDMNDVVTIRKSVLYDIRDNEELYIQITKDFGEGGTTYVVVLVPNGMSPDNFKTLREATSAGARIVAYGSGPP